jgi:hypothetical protein
MPGSPTVGVGARIFALNCLPRSDTASQPENTFGTSGWVFDLLAARDVREQDCF